MIIYKLCTSDVWYVYIPYDYEEGLKVVEEEENYVKVRFIKNQYESWGKITMRSDETGQYYLNLSFTNSMVTFCGDRYLDVELITQPAMGSSLAPWGSGGRE